MGLYPQRYVLYLLSSCPWLNTSGSGSTGNGSSGAYQWHSPCCHDRCRSGLCALSFWRNLCSPHSCIPHSVYLRGDRHKDIYFSDKYIVFNHSVILVVYLTDTKLSACWECHSLISTDALVAGSCLSCPLLYVVIPEDPSDHQNSSIIRECAVALIAGFFKKEQHLQSEIKGDHTNSTQGPASEAAKEQ